MIAYAALSGGGENTVISSIADNELVAVAARWTGSTLRFYYMLDGQSAWNELAGSAGSATEETTEDILLGARSGGTGYFLNGDLGELIIYDRALSDTEMSQNGTYFSVHWCNKSYDAAIAILGASIMRDAFQGNEASVENSLALGYGVYVDVNNHAVGGWDISDLQNGLNNILTNYSGVSYPVFMPIHIGGNDVTNTRPYSSTTQQEKDDFSDGIENILQAIDSARHTPILGDLTFRDYDDTTISNEGNGSMPYNTALIRPLISAYCASFIRQDGTPYWQLYDLVKNNYTTYLLTDNVHHTTAGQAAVRQHLIDGIGKYLFTGIEPDSLEV